MVPQGRFAHAPHWHDARSTSLMRETTRFDAKQPYFEFQHDEQAKQSEATPLLRKLCAAWLDPLYRELEAGEEKSFHHAR